MVAQVTALLRDEPLGYASLVGRFQVFFGWGYLTMVTRVIPCYISIYIYIIYPTDVEIKKPWFQFVIHIQLELEPWFLIQLNILYPKCYGLFFHHSLLPWMTPALGQGVKKSLQDLGGNTLAAAIAGCCQPVAGFGSRHRMVSVAKDKLINPPITNHPYTLS